MKYEYVKGSNVHMQTMYAIARALYSVNRWNQKTTPICIIARGDEVLALGIAGNGMHPLTAHCDRVDKPGSDYSACKWCQEDQHAEIRALSCLKTDARGAKAYLYGHFHACDNCCKGMELFGIETVVLLEKSSELFDRHHPNTVIGKPDQFKMRLPIDLTDWIAG